MPLLASAKESLFTLLRGVASGRVDSENLSLGGKVFVLGGDGYEHAESVYDGDYVEVKQTVDLTNVDIVAPSMKTIGVAMESFITYAGFPSGFDTRAWFKNRDSVVHARNDIVGAPHLYAEGDLAVTVEDYSVNGFNCKQFPAGGTTARLVGTNSPRLYTGNPSRYTIRFLLDFLVSEHASRGGSSGKDITIFDIGDSLDGIRVHLLGLSGVGVNEWNLAVTHRDYGAIDTEIFPGYSWTSDQGFQSIAVRYDFATATPERLKLYVDGVNMGGAAAMISQLPVGPAESTPIQLGAPELYGRLGEFQFFEDAESDAGNFAAHNAVVGPNTEESTQWRMSLLVGGQVYAERVIAENEARSFSDFRAPVYGVSGETEVAFRLTYERS